MKRIRWGMVGGGQADQSLVWKAINFAVSFGGAASNPKA